MPELVEMLFTSPDHKTRPKKVQKSFSLDSYMGVCCAEEGSAAPQQPVSTPAPPPVPSPPPTTQRPTTQRPTTTPRPVTAAPTPAATGRKGDDNDDLTTVVNSLYLRIDLLTFVLFPCRLVGRKPLFFYFGLFTRLHPQSTRSCS